MLFIYILYYYVFYITITVYIESVLRINDIVLHDHIWFNAITSIVESTTLLYCLQVYKTTVILPLYYVSHFVLRFIPLLFKIM